MKTNKYKLNKLVKQHEVCAKEEMSLNKVHPWRKVIIVLMTKYT